ncbi:MAG: bifunctional diaminohydroxyphosphoribosylaminopyrimidine deaminase/5-amino-6-(5-phosphoribosylamino)uracil reductase RibD [Thermogutta sp.]
MGISQAELDAWHMARALEIAGQGRGKVEPNPMVGCVIARGAEIIGEGYHQRYGGPHAEIEALRVAGSRAAGAVMYVTLEPCCHHGKTPPCTEAVIASGVSRVVVAMQDPFAEVAGKGLETLRQAGIEVSCGLMEREARELNAPYLKLLSVGRPWVIAKWAMTLDGKIATVAHESRWISGPASRARSHLLRGRVDAILVGSGTVLADDPLLTVRPPGDRTPLRVVLDGRARIPLESQLVRTARETPVLIAVNSGADAGACQALEAAGCEILVCPGDDCAARLDFLLAELGKRRMTNVLIEGGSRLLGAVFDAGMVDEVHVFAAPKLFGGHAAPTPIAGEGIASIAAAKEVRVMAVERLDADIYIQGRLTRP